MSYIILTGKRLDLQGFYPHEATVGLLGSPEPLPALCSHFLKDNKRQLPKGLSPYRAFPRKQERQGPGAGVHRILSGARAAKQATYLSAGPLEAGSMGTLKDRPALHLCWSSALSGDGQLLPAAREGWRWPQSGRCLLVLSHGKLAQGPGWARCERPC